LRLTLRCLSSGCRFLAKYQAKYEKAAHCLAKDREALLAFYAFPAE
jgi:hypothetical protein